MEYFKSLRPGVSILAALLVLASFSDSGWTNYAILLAFGVFFASGATMVQNDYHDRFHDAKKGRTFAEANEAKVKQFAVFMWGVCFVFAIAIALVNYLHGIVYLGVVIVGLLYSEVLLVPFVPNFLVAFASAVSTLYAMNQQQLTRPAILFLIVFLIISLRESIKDLEDCVIDVGHKWTFPIAFGVVKTKKIILILSALAIFPIYGLVGYGVIPSVIFLLGANILLMKGYLGKAKNYLDMGMVIFLIIICFI